MQINLLMFAILGVSLMYLGTGIILTDASNEYSEAYANQSYLQNFSTIAVDITSTTSQMQSNATTSTSSEQLSAGLGIFGPAITALSFLNDMGDILNNVIE